MAVMVYSSSEVDLVLTSVNTVFWLPAVGELHSLELSVCVWLIIGVVNVIFLCPEVYL